MVCVFYACYSFHRQYQLFMFKITHAYVSISLALDWPTMTFNLVGWQYFSVCCKAGGHLPAACSKQRSLAHGYFVNASRSQDTDFKPPHSSPARRLPQTSRYVFYQYQRSGYLVHLRSCLRCGRLPTVPFKPIPFNFHQVWQFACIPLHAAQPSIHCFGLRYANCVISVSSASGESHPTMFLTQTHTYTQGDQTCQKSTTVLIATQQ